MPLTSGYFRVTAVVFFSLVAQWAAAAPASEPNTPATQKLVDAWQTTRSGGIAVALIGRQEIAYYHAGQFAANDSRPITPDTLFEIGSVTKAFTAILLSDAVERGVVQLDDSIGAPFPQSPITYRQLATHTSGLPRMGPRFFSNDAENPFADETLARLVASFATAAPKAKPSQPIYSNFGVAVLGQAVAGATKTTWASAMQSRVLAPLGLTDTWLSIREADPKRLSPGHREGMQMPHWDFDAYAPTGAIVSTSRDLVRLVRAMLGTLETPVNSIVARTLQRVIWDDTASNGTGLAWKLERRVGQHLASHNGITAGFNAFVGINAAKTLGVVVLSNDVTTVEPLGYALLTGEPLTKPEGVWATPRTVVQLRGEELEPYVGRYQMTPSVEITVRRETDRLLVQLTGQPFTRVVAEAKDRFFYRVVNAQLTFERDSAGVVNAVVLHQNGNDHRAPRILSARDMCD